MWCIYMKMIYWWNYYKEYPIYLFCYFWILGDIPLNHLTIELWYDLVLIYQKSDTIIRNGYCSWWITGGYFTDRKDGCTYIYFMNKGVIQIRFVHSVLGGVDSGGFLGALRMGIWILFSIWNGCNNLCGGWSIWYKLF